MIRASLTMVLILASAATAAPDSVTVTAEPVARFHRAVGSVQPRHHAKVMAQASGRVLEVRSREGQRVEAGELLALVEDRELSLRLAQARRGVEEAEAARSQAQQGQVAAAAALEQARAERERVKRFLSQEAATPQQMEAVEAAFRQAQAASRQAGFGVDRAEASLARAREGVEEVEVVLEHTRVTAPLAGLIAERSIEPGDLAWPGRPLFSIQDPDHLQLEARVREGLAGQVRPGLQLEVHVDALDADLAGVVTEVTPLADPVSRKFTVKVSLPTDPRLLPGMFGRLRVPVGTREAILVPAGAVQDRGQLSFVRVRSGSGWTRRLVRIGEPRGERLEVLSGLQSGDEVALGETP